jgi:uncharacterized protein YdeI (YjbR/CyaY-like superfamily)
MDSPIELLMLGSRGNRMSKKSTRLKRPRYQMPEFVRTALEERNLMAAYFQRPAYQQNDYIGWITRAKMAATQQKRLQQMLDELFRGDVYMKMAYRPKNRQE